MLLTAGLHSNNAGLHLLLIQVVLGLGVRADPGVGARRRRRVGLAVRAAGLLEVRRFFRCERCCRGIQGVAKNVWEKLLRMEVGKSGWEKLLSPRLLSPIITNHI